MADGNWLRLLSGPRSRTPAKPTNSASPPLESSASATTSQQGNPQQPKQDAQQNEQPTGPDAEAIPQRRTHSGHSKALSRLPSWPALSQAASTPAAPKSSTPDLFVREADRVAHNPSMDHIVDTLLAAVMSNQPSSPWGQSMVLPFSISSKPTPPQRRRHPRHKTSSRRPLSGGRRRTMILILW